MAETEKSSRTTKLSKLGILMRDECVINIFSCRYCQLFLISGIYWYLCFYLGGQLTTILNLTYQKTVKISKLSAHRTSLLIMNSMFQMEDNIIHEIMMAIIIIKKGLQLIIIKCPQFNEGKGKLLLII